MPGLDPGIHQSSSKVSEEDGSPGHLARRRASRFCPAMTISIGMTALQPTVLGCSEFESRTHAAAGEFSLALADPLWVPAGEKGHRHCRDIEPASIQLDHALESRGFNPRR